MHGPPATHLRQRQRQCMAGLALGVVLAAWARAHAAELRLRLLETTDLHMNLLNHDYYQDKPTDTFGLAKTATLIKAARAEVKNSLLFDNGDLIQGSPLGDCTGRLGGACQAAGPWPGAPGLQGAELAGHGRRQPRQP